MSLTEFGLVDDDRDKGIETLGDWAGYGVGSTTKEEIDGLTESDKECENDVALETWSVAVENDSMGTKVNRDGDEGEYTKVEIRDEDDSTKDGADRLIVDGYGDTERVESSRFE